MSVEEGVLLACSGFLLAVLWMDLIFDTQVRARGATNCPSRCSHPSRTITVARRRHHVR